MAKRYIEESTSVTVEDLMLNETDSGNVKAGAADQFLRSSADRLCLVCFALACRLLRMSRRISFTSWQLSGRT